MLTKFRQKINAARKNSVFDALVRLFFSRFFDKESLSPQGDAEANVYQTLGMLAAPGFIISLLLYFLIPRSITGRDLVAVRCLVLSASMAIIAFIVVFEWDALFPDLRDYQVLLPLPLPLWKVFVAKIAAFIVFLAMFLAALNLFSVLFWPSLFDQGNYFAVMGTYLSMVGAAGLFSALAAACVQGVLLAVVPAKWFRPVAIVAQTALMSATVMLFFLCPLLANVIGPLLSNTNVAGYIPAYWFTGLYEHLRPATGDPALLAAGKMALPGLGWVLAIFALTYLPGYMRQTRKLIDTPPVNPAGPGRMRAAINRVLDRVLLKDPLQQGVFHFIGQTISRSMKHRLFLAVYGGFGAALVLYGIDSDNGLGLVSLMLRRHRFQADNIGLLQIPLTLSFVLISGLRAAFSFPAELRANWAFQISDPNQTRQCMIAMRKWVVVCGVIPLFLLMAPLERAFFSWPVVLVQMVCGVTLAILLIELMFFDFRKIPFTCGYFPERSNLVWLVVIYLGCLTLYSSTMANLESWLMWEPRYIPVFLAAAACVWFAIWQWHGRAKQEDGLDYLGDDDPVIRTLELTPH